jgi:Zn finger protein HypA/HybF involved in hydrogenase expression
MPGDQYECKDCGRAFLVDEDKKRKPKCPGCEGGNVAPKEPRPLPLWIRQLKNETGSG